MNPDDLNEQEQRIASMADRMLSRGRPAAEVEQFVRRAMGRQDVNRAEASRVGVPEGSGFRQTAARALTGLESLTEGATLGASGLVGDALAAGFDPDRGFADVRRDRTQRRGAYAEERPKTDLALSVAGGILTPGIGAGRLAQTGAKALGTGRAAKVVGSLGTLAAEGAAQAGVEGTLRGVEGTDMDALKKAFTSGARGALIGGIAAPVLSPVAGLAARGGEGLARLASRGQTSAGAKTIANRLGVEALDPLAGDAAALARRPDAMAADVLPGGGRNLRAAMNVSPQGETVARTRLLERGAQVGPRAERAMAEAAGVAPGDVALTKDAMLRAQRERADELFTQARTEGREFDAIPGRVRDRFAEMERMAEQKALPGPGQSVSAKRDLPRPQDVDGDIAWPGVPARRRRETVAQESAREALETRRPSRMTPEGERPVELRAANDVNVRRPFAEPEAVTSTTPDRFAMARGTVDRALENERVQSEIASVVDESADLAAMDPGSFDMMSTVYQRLNKEFGVLKKNGQNAGPYFQALQSARRAVRKALDSRSETFPVANREFAESARQQQAYALGEQLFSKRKSAGELRLAMEQMTPEQQRMFRRGALDAMAGKLGNVSPNRDLGVSARQSKRAGQVAVDTDAARGRVREVFGDAGYMRLLREARDEGTFSQTMEEATRNSTTAKQLRDMAEDPDAGRFFSRGSTLFGTVGNFAADALAGAARRGQRLVAEGGNREAADLLTRQGPASIQDVMAQVERELMRRQAARETGNQVGRQAVPLLSRGVAGNDRRR